MSDEVDPFNPPKLNPVLPHVQRMGVECQKLVTRLVALDKFLHGEIFGSLSPIEQKLIVEQRHQMEEYAKTLSLRYYMALLKREKPNDPV